MKARQVLPMDGAAIAVEQPETREDVAACAERADVGAAPLDLPQPDGESRVLEQVGIDTAADEDRGQAFGGLSDRQVRGDAEPCG